MERCLFAENFWGEKNTGFDVLYQNLKSSCRSTSDFAEFVRESSSIEDAYYKSLLKLAKQTASYSNNNVSSFKPCWSVLRQLVEQLGQLHLAFAQSRQSLSKDVQKYLEEQQKRHKSIRDAETSTQEVVHAFQVTAVQLHRAKEVYHSRYAEYERTVRSESNSTREQEKVEAKLKKAQDEYKYSVEKYNNLRNQFVSKMSASCAQFQEIEVAHLEQMREFMQRYSSVWSTTRETMDKLCAQFDEDLTKMTTMKLLEMFVAERGTGSTQPRIVPFEDAEVAAVFSPSVEHSTPGGAVAVRALGMFNIDQRASSALAIVGSASKDNGHVSQNSLTDLSVDAVSMTSNSLAAAPTAISGPTTAKRREGFFRRRRNSLTQEPGLSASESATVAESMRMGNTHPIGGSLSAFTVVAKRGIRRLGTPLSNGKDKLANKQDSKSATSLTEDWRMATGSELPKDEEGFTIRPSDPWAEPTCEDQSDQGVSDSDSDVDIVGRTFKGLKVNIRPPGDFVPGMATLPSPKKPSPGSRYSNTTRLSVRGRDLLLVDLRGSKHGRNGVSARSVNLTKAHPNQTTTNLLQVLPTAPALPPPPPAANNGPSDELSFLMDSKEPKASVVRPRASGVHTWSRKATGNSHHGALSDHLQTDLLSLDPLFSKSPPPQSSAPTAWEVLGKQSEGAMAFRNSESFHSGGGFRRCASAVPPSSIATDTTNCTEKSSWQPFDSDTGNALWQTTTPRTTTPNANFSWPKDSISQFSPSPNTSTFDPKAPSECSTLSQFAPLARPDSRVSGKQNSTMSIPSFSSGTIGPWNQVPTNQAGSISVAAAFTETWRARFHNGGGSSFSTAAMITPPPIQAVSGELTLAFPRTSVEQMVTHSAVGPLVLRLNNAVRLKDLQLRVVGSSMVGCPLESAAPMSSPSSGVTMDFVLTVPGSVLMERFVDLLAETASSKTGTCIVSNNQAMSYLKMDILSYTVDVCQGSDCAPYPALTPPIHLCTYWRCDRTVTDFRLDYTTRWPSDKQITSRTSRGDLRVILNVDGGVTRMQSLPVGTWMPELSRATWQIPLTPSTDDLGVNSRETSIDTSGTVRAKFTLDHGPGRPQPVALQFFREDCLASGVQLILDCPMYRLSLCKRRVIGDRYVCDPPNHSTRFQLHPLSQADKSSIPSNHPSPPARVPSAARGQLNEQWMQFPTSASNDN